MRRLFLCFLLLFPMGKSVVFAADDMRSILNDLKTTRDAVFAESAREASGHFTFVYLQPDSQAVSEMADSLEAAYSRISTGLNTKRISPITVFVYPSLKSFHSILPMKDAPGWVAGKAWGKDEIHIVSLNNPGPSHNRESILTISVHEFAHCATANITELTPDFPCWLSEGIALYFAGQFQNPKDFVYIREGKYPSLALLSDQVNGLEKVYEVSYTLVEYIVDTWGDDSLHDLVLNRGDIRKTLGISEQDFEAGWHGYIEAKYLKS